jgi:sulfite reductase alpha subunit-like flavoprotein
MEFNKLTENLIEITMIATAMLLDEEIEIHDSLYFKEELTKLANEFEDEYKNYDFNENFDYLDIIEQWSKEKLTSLYGS